MKEIYDILVEMCGADENNRSQFDAVFPCSEWRFQGKLGFGGKLYMSRNKLYVSCYPEDMNPTRMSIITRANKKLDSLKKLS